MHFLLKNLIKRVIKREEKKMRILANIRFLHIVVLQWTIIVQFNFKKLQIYNEITNNMKKLCSINAA